MGSNRDLLNNHSSEPSSAEGLLLFAAGQFVEMFAKMHQVLEYFCSSYRYSMLLV